MDEIIRPRIADQSASLLVIECSASPRWIVALSLLPTRLAGVLSPPLLNHLIFQWCEEF